MKWDEKCKFYVCTFYVWCSFCLNVFKLLTILHLRSSWLWKTGQFLEDTANLLIAQIRIWVPHPFLWNYCFIGICLQSFMILFQWVLGCKNWVEDLRVIANLLFGTLLTQIREHAMPIFKGIIVILEHIYNLVMILHPTSSWLWKSGLVFESHSQFANSGSSAPNKEIGCHAHFLFPSSFSCLKINGTAISHVEGLNIHQMSIEHWTLNLFLLHMNLLDVFCLSK